MLNKIHHKIKLILSALSKTDTVDECQKIGKIVLVVHNYFNFIKYCIYCHTEEILDFFSSEYLISQSRLKLYVIFIINVS